MTVKKFSSVSRFLTELKLTANPEEGSVFVLNINEINKHAQPQLKAFRNSFYECNIVKSQTGFLFYVDDIKYESRWDAFVSFISPDKLQSCKVVAEGNEVKGYLLYIPKTSAASGKLLINKAVGLDCELKIEFEAKNEALFHNLK